ncbi:PAS domain S-box protein, partial [bacterium]|nr:PAS domain S-box protein [bacterium]
IWVQSRSSFAHDEGTGANSHLIVVTRDITETKRREKELREKEARFRALFEQSPLALEWLSPEGVIQFANPATAELFGLHDPEDSIGFDVSLDPNAPDELKEAIRTKTPLRMKNVFDFGETGGNVQYDTEHRGVKHFDFNLIPLKDERNECFGFLFQIEDITERAVAEQALRDSEERLQLALEAGQLGLWDWDVQSNRVAYNDRAVTMLGYEPPMETARPEEYLQLVQPDYRESVEAHIQAHFRGEIPGIHLEYPALHRDGHAVWSLVKGRTVERDADGKPVRLIGTLQDITEQRTLQEKMMQAQKLESLGLLAGGIAHDFNNLLVGILGNADLALDDLSTLHPAHKCVQQIGHAATRAADLAKQMLAYSGKGRFVVEPVPPAALIDEMAHMMRVSISKKVTLRIDEPDSLLLVQADPTQLRQLIMNLLTNASEAIGDEVGVIRISTSAMELNREEIKTRFGEDSLPEGRYVHLEVRDTGCGMSEATLRRIFDPFFTTRFTGRGLGLSAVQGIVRGHHGALKVSSQPGEGTTFEIILPALEESESPHQQTTHPVARASSDPNGTVLLVDDDEAVRIVGSRMLRKLGYEVLTARDGREAVDLYRSGKNRISCVLLDLTMPVMDGEEAFNALRGIDPEVSVVLSSGFNEQEIHNRFAGRKVAGFVQKPYKMKALENVLQSVAADRAE